MTIQINKIITWGRSFDEYIDLFSLAEHELHGKTILACADGTSSFNCEGTKKGISVTSCDPLYGNVTSPPQQGTCRQWWDETSMWFRGLYEWR